MGARDNEPSVHHGRSAIDAASALRPANPSRLADDVGSRLRESILNGIFVAGDRLREEELAAAMGVSRGPVRDALAQLDREGLVVRRPNRGAIVAELFRGDFDEVFSLRLAIEPVAAAWAARHASDADLREMHRIVSGYSKLTASAPICSKSRCGRYATSNARPHAAICPMQLVQTRQLTAPSIRGVGYLKGTVTGPGTLVKTAMKSRSSAVR
jgi:DNA-binding GntR family transcriptional regulator